MRNRLLQSHSHASQNGNAGTTLISTLSIFIGLVSFTAWAQETKPLAVLENSQMRLEFGANGLSCAERLPDGLEVIHGAAPMLQLEIADAKGGNIRTLGAQTTWQISRTQTPKPQVRYTATLAPGLGAVCTVTLDGQLSRWRTVLQVPAGTIVRRMTFPAISKARIGKQGSDDQLIVPRSDWLQKMINPAGCDHPQEWGSGLSPELASLWDADGGLYVGAENTPLYDIAWQVRPAGDESIDLAVRTDITVQGPATWSSPDYVLAPHRGDWHWACDRYREWFDKTFKTPEVPAWAKDCDVWGGGDSDAFKDLGFDAILREAQRLQKNRVPLQDIYSAMLDGQYQACGDQHYPCPLWGTADQFTEVNRRVHELGMRTMYYFNWRTWTPSWKHQSHIGTLPASLVPKEYNWPGDDWFLRNASNPSQHPIHMVGNWVNICLQSPDWQAHHLEVANNYFKWGASGLYHDQIMGGEGDCQNPNHGHLLPGDNERATVDLLRRTMAAMRKLDPDWVTCGEGCSSPIGQYLTFHLASGVYTNTHIYRYAFPQHIVFDGQMNGGDRAWDYAKRFPEGRYLFTFIMGARFDMLPENEFGRKMLALRRKTKQWLYRARYTDSVGVNITDPSRPAADPHAPLAPNGKAGAGEEAHFLNAKRFILNDGADRLILVNVANPKAVAGAAVTVDVTPLAKVNAAWQFALSGKLERLPLTLQDGKFRFTPSVERLSTVVLTDQCTPLLAVNMANSITAGETITGTADVINLNAQPVSGTLGWRAPQGWSTTASVLAVLAPGSVKTLPVSLTAPRDAAWGFKDLFCTATVGKAGGECYHTICVARPVIADLTADIRGIPTAMTFTNRSMQPQTVEARLVGDGNVQDTGWRTLTVPAKGAKSVAIAPKYTTLPATWSDLFVEFKRDGKLERNALRAWNRAVWNGSFEMHSPGSTMPDFWSLIDYSGKEDGAKLVSLAKLDDQYAQEGKYSLRIDPYRGNVANFTLCVFPASFRLEHNKKYSLTGYIRCPKGGVGSITGGQDWVALRPVGEPDARGWQKVERIFTTEHTDWSFTLVLCNSGKTPVWFDNISVTEVE